jgi:hypothetical protein
MLSISYSAVTASYIDIDSTGMIPGRAGGKYTLVAVTSTYNINWNTSG